MVKGRVGGTWISEDFGHVPNGIVQGIEGGEFVLPCFVGVCANSITNIACECVHACFMYWVSVFFLPYST